MNIAILTGAGISAESGIATFRDSGGLWCNYKVEDVATPDGYYSNPRLVHEFYNQRRAELAGVYPNAAHIALAKLEAGFADSGKVTLITQNIDDLHERAGSGNVIHMHGELNKIRCDNCGNVFIIHDDCYTDTPCSSCGRQKSLRPDIVWFGENIMHLESIEQALTNCDLFMSIGTSGTVYPAAAFVNMVPNKAHTVLLNLEKLNGANKFAEKIYGKAATVVPEYVEKLLNGV